jgi:hypothetical protein
MPPKGYLPVSNIRNVVSPFCRPWIMPEYRCLVPVTQLAALTAIPSWKLFSRVGIAPARALLCFLPLGFVIMVWKAAYRRWPSMGTN